MPTKIEQIIGSLSGSKALPGQTSFARNRLGNLLQGQAADVFSQGVTDSQFFNQGQAALQESIDDQAKRDASAAAARGLSGSSFEIGQLGARSRRAGTGLQQLLIGSEQSLQARQAQAAGNLLNFQSIQESALNSERSFQLGRGDLELRHKIRRDQRRAANQRFVGGLFRSGVNLLGNLFGGSGGAAAAAGAA